MLVFKKKAYRIKIGLLVMLLGIVLSPCEKAFATSNADLMRQIINGEISTDINSVVQKHNAANVLTIQVQNLTQQTQETTQEIAILTQQVTTLTQEKQGLLQQVATLTQEKEEAIRYFTA